MWHQDYMTYLDFSPVIDTSLGDARGEGERGKNEESREASEHMHLE